MRKRSSCSGSDHDAFAKPIRGSEPSYRSFRPSELVSDQPGKSRPSRRPPASVPAGKPAPGGTGGPEPNRRHRGLVWSLIVLASVVLVFSLLANWVQTEALETDQVENTTDQILADPDVQQALAIYTVDELYANVDVQGQIEKELPSAAKPLALPVAAATRQLATNAAERALASPQAQDLVSAAVGRAQKQFVSLIDDKGAYVSTTGGNVTLEYGSLVADLATRLGVDPSTISRLQGFVRSFSQELPQRLTTAKAQIASVRSYPFSGHGRQADADAEAKFQALQGTAADVQTKVASLEQALQGVQGKVPPQLQGRVSKLQGRLSPANVRLASLEQRTATVLKDPSQANVQTLDASLASLQGRIDLLLGRQIVQTPGQLVLMRSSQLSGLQTLASLLRNLGFVLPALALLLYLGALCLAKGGAARP